MKARVLGTLFTKYPPQPSKDVFFHPNSPVEGRQEIVFPLSSLIIYYY